MQKYHMADYIYDIEDTDISTGMGLEQSAPSCLTPEKDNPYPLCVGGKTECEDCCLYTDYEKKHVPYKEVVIKWKYF